MDQPRISVITGYYNRADAVEQSINSILQQDFENFEFIIFDDASTDDTLNKLRRFDDLRIRLIAHPRNMGFVRGLIHAVSIARGEFIAIHGSGDISHPSRLRRQLEVLEADPSVSLVGCYYRTIRVDGSELKVHTPNADAVSLEKLLKGNVFSHGEVMFRKSHYEVVGGYRPEFKYCQDYDLWVRMRQVGRFATVPEVLYTRVAREDGVSYRPEKVVEQAHYAALVGVLAKSDSAEAESILNRVREKGVRAVISASHPVVVRMVTRRVGVLSAMRRWDNAWQTLLLVDRSNHIVYGLLRVFVWVGSRFDWKGWISRVTAWAYRRKYSRKGAP